MNSLRFPLEEFLFPPLSLSERERDEYERTAHILLTKALDEYDRYNREDQRRVNRSLWTPVKKRERLTVYKSVQKPGMPALPLPGAAAPMRRGRAATAKGTAPPSPPRGLMDNPPEDWSAPTLLQVGCIPGTLDDVMFGMTTFDATDMLLEASYTPDEALDAEMLCEIQGPTPSDPFRFLGIKWLVLGNPPGINIVVRPRDMVFLEATGVINRAVDGHADSVERIGYLVMHSVHLSGHGPLLDKKIVRARTSSCFLFKQLPFADAVDVFMTSSFDPSGSVAEVLAVQSAAHTLTYCGQVTDCAYGKKLAWLLRQTRGNDPARSMRRRSSASSGSDVTSDDLSFAAGLPPSAGSAGLAAGSRACAVCCKDLGSLFSKRASRCALCKTALCANCHVKKKVSFPGPIRKEVDVKTLAFCTACLARAGQLSTLAVARSEVAARLRNDGTLASLSSPSAATSVSVSLMPPFRRPMDADASSRRRNTKLALDQIHLGSSRGDTFDGSVRSDHHRDDADLELDIELEVADRVRSRTSSGATSSHSGGSRNSAGVSAGPRKPSALPRVTLIDADDLPRFSSAQVVDDHEEEEEDDDDVVEAEAALPPLASAPPAGLSPEQVMMAQIAELRSTAESVYQYARLNTEAHLSQSASAMSQLQALALDDEDERGRQFMSARGASAIREDSSER